MVQPVELVLESLPWVVLGTFHEIGHQTIKESCGDLVPMDSLEESLPTQLEAALWASSQIANSDGLRTYWW